MNISEIFRYVNYVSAKELAGRTFTPQEFGLIYPETELTFFRSIARPPADQYHNWRVLQPAVDDIRLQTLKRQTTITLAQSVGNLPSVAGEEFLDWLSFAVNVTVQDNCGNDVSSEVPVEVVVDDEWSTRLAAAVRRPTTRYPILKFFQSTVRQVQVAPTAITQVVCRYYKKPVRPVFGFTTDANDNIIYNPVTSVQSEFPDIAQEQIINFLLEKVGVNLSKESLTQYSQMVKQVG